MFRFKKHLASILIAILLSFQLTSVVFAEEPIVTIIAISQDAKILFQDIALQAGLNIVIDDSINSRVTIDLKSIDAEQALNTVAKIAGASVTYDNGIYIVQNARISYPSIIQTEQISTQVFDLSKVNYDNAIRIIRSIAFKMEIEEFPEMKVVLVRGVLAEMNLIKNTIDQYLRDAANSNTQVTDEKIMTTVYISYVDVSEVAMAVQGQFPNVRVQSSRTTSTLILYGPPSEIAQVKATVKELDRTPAVLHFDLEIVEISETDGSNIGIDWTNSQGQYGTFSVNFTENSPSYNSQDSQVDFRPWTRSSLNLVANIRLLKEAGKAKTIAHPTVTVLENKSARVSTLDRYAIMTGQSSYPQYVDAGVTLDISGKLDAHGDIIVSLTPKVSGITGFSKEGYPITSTREVNTTVILKPGETLVIGGLMRFEETTITTGVPFLSSLPVIGKLFGSTKTTTRTTELVIMLTPQVSSNL